MRRVTWARWGRSAYETDADRAAEVAALAPWVDLVGEGADAVVLSLASKVIVDGALLDRTPSARLVVTTTSGTDHPDLDELRRRGVVAARLPEARRDAVVESALGMMLAGLRRQGALQEAAAEGRWARGALPALAPRGIAGRRIGVVGLGVIGRQMAAVLGVMGAEVWGCDPAGLPVGVRDADLDTQLTGCDAVTLHCDLNPSTRGMVSAARLAGARPGLVLVNTARGALLDVDAAVAALDAGRLGGLGVDVFPTEPWPRLAAVRGRPDLCFTPHAAGYHDRLAERVREGLAAAVGAFVAGEPVPHRVA